MGILFDGVDDFVTLGDVLDIGLSDWSVSLWMKTNTEHFCRLVSKNPTGTGEGWLLGLGVAPVITIGIDQIFTAISFSYADNEWHHMVGNWDRDANAEIFMDTVSRGTLDISSKVAVNVQNAISTCIGCRDEVSGFFDGQMIEVTIRNSILTQDDINQEFNSKIKHMPLQVQTGAIQAYWPMDDGPDGASADGDKIAEGSGNGNDGIGDNGANNSGLIWKAEEALSGVPDIFPVIFVPAVAAAIMNQFQGPDLGANLYNGSFM